MRWMKAHTRADLKMENRGNLGDHVIVKWKESKEL